MVFHVLSVVLYVSSCYCPHAQCTACIVSRSLQVIEVLLPVFLDDDEDELVRIAAFTTILKCDPPAPYLYMIARSLDDEENPLVGSYVYSYLTEVSNTTYPCFSSL